MNDFDMEDRLERELGPLDAPEGFADRVMWRVAAREVARKQARRRVQGWRMAVAASLLVCLGLGGYQVEERREAAEARAQFAEAIRVTGRSLEAVDRGLGRLDERKGATR